MLRKKCSTIDWADYNIIAKIINKLKGEFDDKRRYKLSVYNLFIGIDYDYLIYIIFTILKNEGTINIEQIHIDYYSIIFDKLFLEIFNYIKPEVNIIDMKNIDEIVDNGDNGDNKLVGIFFNDTPIFFPTNTTDVQKISEEGEEVEVGKVGKVGKVKNIFDTIIILKSTLNRKK